METGNAKKFNPCLGWFQLWPRILHASDGIGDAAAGQGWLGPRRAAGYAQGQPRSDLGFSALKE